MSEWTRWYSERPTDRTKVYRWRVSKRPILGLELQPEWSEKLTLCGMDCADNEYWPLSASHWDGYQRTVDETLEWGEATADERIGEVHIKWNGFDLLPCPFLGMQPQITIGRRYIGAPPYELEWIGVLSHLVNSHGWHSAKAMQDTWNERA